MRSADGQGRDPNVGMENDECPLAHVRMHSSSGVKEGMDVYREWGQEEERGVDIDGGHVDVGN